jgi:glycosyltransferase involved in cell wall biosynthesis
LGDIVSFCGFVDDILPIFREIDFMVMPSRSEGMPVVILEAWSQQVGVLATSVGGIPEMIKSGQSGLLVPPENVAELSDKLLWALNHRDRMDQFGRAGFELVKEKYTYPVQAARLAAVYSGLTASRGQRKPPDRSTRS